MEELYIKKYGDIYPVAEMEAYVQIDYFDRNGLKDESLGFRKTELM